MIVSFGDRATEDLFHGVRSNRVRRFPANIVGAALVKLDALNAAQVLEDLRSPPGNRLEALHGDLRGFYSIRINGQWRVIFRWQASDSTLAN
jgi:toxin HigB-1